MEVEDRIGREEEEVSVAVSSSIVPGTCAHPAPSCRGKKKGALPQSAKGGERQESRGRKGKTRGSRSEK